MKNEIKNNIENPKELECLYQNEKKVFKKAFFQIYPEISSNKAAAFWKARFDYQPGSGSYSATKKDIFHLVLVCLLSGFLIQIPQIFGLNSDEFLFFEKNTALILFLGLTVYSIITKAKTNGKQLLLTLSIFVVSFIYINLLPSNKESNSIDLAYIHLPIMIWFLYGLVFNDFNWKDKMYSIRFIRYNGDLAIMSGLILIAGGALTVITIGLFNAIDIKIGQYLNDHIFLLGFVLAPVVASFIIRNFPLIANKIAPLIAQIFSPLVLITLVVYLVSIVVSGKDPYNDRNFLLIFNLMLLGVMAIIVFSISEISLHEKHRLNEIVLLLLTIVSLTIDLFALSAILYRVGEFGFTPNRTAVLGSNLLIFGNLVLILVDLFKVNFRNKSIKKVEQTITSYLPFYAIWTILVVFLFPLIFGFK